jgi:hypothetical protein
MNSTLPLPDPHESDSSSWEEELDKAIFSFEDIQRN